MRKFITNLNKPGVLFPIVMLEVTVDTGRTYQAYKRGGKTEARERATEETLAGGFWLGGVTLFNKIGDALGSRFLKIPKAEFDLAKDAVRNPLDLFLNKNNLDAFKKKVVLFKLGKIIASIMGTWIVVGTLIPKFNQAVTRKLLSGKKPAENKKEKETKITETPPKSIDEIKELINKGKNPAFKGLPSIDTLAIFANNLENHAVYKLIATDTGLLGSRVTNARNKDERVEIAVRDLCSMYFYYACGTHIREFLNSKDGYKGKLSTLNPMAAMQVHNELLKAVQKEGAIPIDAVGQKLLVSDAKNIEALLKKIHFEKDGIISLEKLIKTAKEKGIKLDVQKAAKMAELQPERSLEIIKGKKQFNAILTKAQVFDVLNNSYMSNPDVIKKVMQETFGKDFSKPFKFIDQKAVEKIRADMDNYVLALIEYAKKHNLKEITGETLDKVSKLNMTRNAIHTSAGFGVCVLFLSTLIPKFQYWVTKKRTGKDAFPGVQSFETGNG